MLLSHSCGPTCCSKHTHQGNDNADHNVSPTQGKERGKKGEGRVERKRGEGRWARGEGRWERGEGEREGKGEGRSEERDKLTGRKGLVGVTLSKDGLISLQTE